MSGTGVAMSSPGSVESQEYRVRRYSRPSAQDEAAYAVAGSSESTSATLTMRSVPPLTPLRLVPPLSAGRLAEQPASASTRQTPSASAATVLRALGIELPPSCRHLRRPTGRHAPAPVRARTVAAASPSHLGTRLLPTRARRPPPLVDALEARSS